MTGIKTSTQTNTPVIPWTWPWEKIKHPSPSHVIEDELKRELNEKHILYGKKVEAIGRRVNQDDILFKIPPDNSYAVVHLTYSGEREADHRFPRTQMYLSLKDWIGNGLLKDVEDEKEIKEMIKKEITGEGNCYLIRIVGSRPLHMDPDIDIAYVDNNPFGFKRPHTRWEWIHKKLWLPKKKKFEVSPEPPGLQVAFYYTTKSDEEKILAYLQKGIPENTEIIQT